MKIRGGSDDVKRVYARELPGQSWVEVIPELLYKDTKLPSMTFLGPPVPIGARSQKPASLRTPC